MLKVAAAEVVYGIWRVRNDMVFGHKPMPLHLVTDLKHVISTPRCLDRKLVTHVPVIS